MVIVAAVRLREMMCQAPEMIQRRCISMICGILILILHTLHRVCQDLLLQKKAACCLQCVHLSSVWLLLVSLVWWQSRQCSDSFCFCICCTYFFIWCMCYVMLPFVWLLNTLFLSLGVLMMLLVPLGDRKVFRLWKNAATIAGVLGANAPRRICPLNIIIMF